MSALALYVCNNKTLTCLRIARNAAAHLLANLLKSYIHTRHLILINAGNQHGNCQNNTIPPWSLTCTCNTTHCESLPKLRPHIVVQGAAHKQNGPLIPNLDLTIQIIEFMHDRFLDYAIPTKEDKYDPLTDAMKHKARKLDTS